MKRLPFIFYLFLFSVFTAFLSCEEDKSEAEVLVVDLKPFSDATITNSVPRTIADNFEGAHGKALRIGWDYVGPAMRSFITFDISSILPDSDEELIINNATLIVYEENTNLHPFDVNKESRTIDVYLLDYDNLDFSDFDLTPIASCGSIATWGYNVLEGHSLDVTAYLSDYYSNNMDVDKVQFRLQITDDIVVPQTDNSGYDGNMWSIFAKEDYSEHVPRLNIEYLIQPVTN
jgi:hypothetical protein